MPCSPYQHHFKLVSEAMQALSWVVYTGPNCGAHQASSQPCLHTQHLLPHCAARLQHLRRQPTNLQLLRTGMPPEQLHKPAHAAASHLLQVSACRRSTLKTRPQLLTFTPTRCAHIFVTLLW